MANPGTSVGPNLSDVSSDGGVQDSGWGDFPEYSDTNGASEGDLDTLDVERGHNKTTVDDTDRRFMSDRDPVEEEIEYLLHTDIENIRKRKPVVVNEQIEQDINWRMDEIHRKAELLAGYEKANHIRRDNIQAETRSKGGKHWDAKERAKLIDERVPHINEIDDMTDAEKSQYIIGRVPKVDGNIQIPVHEPAYTQGQTGEDVPAVDKDNETLAVPQTVEEPADVLVETPADTTQETEAAQGAKLAVEEAALPVLDSAGNTETRQLTSWKTLDISKTKGLIKSLRKEGLTLLKTSEKQKELIDAIATSIEYWNYLDEIAECQKKTMENLLDAESKASNGFLSKAGLRLRRRWTSWLGRRRERKVNRRYRTECAVASIRGDINSNRRDTLGGPTDAYAIKQRLDEIHSSPRGYNYGTDSSDFALSVMNGIKTGSADGPTVESKRLQEAREKMSSDGTTALTIKQGLERKE